MVDPKVSEYFRNLRKKVKNPYLPFKDRDYAKLMSRRAVDARQKAKEAGSSKTQEEG